MSALDERDLAAAADLLSNASRIAVMTGAGISAESGVPTFRGAGGFWRGRSAMDLATPQAFNRDPEDVWKFYRYRIDGLSRVEPNAGHRALVSLERRCKRFWLITQNVDGLHHAAGSERVIELHGTLAEVRCRVCAYRCPSSESCSWSAPRDSSSPPLHSRGGPGRGEPRSWRSISRRRASAPWPT